MAYVNPPPTATIQHILSQADVDTDADVHVVTSALDYCRSLLSGCPGKFIKTLQLLHAVAFPLTKTRQSIQLNWPFTTSPPHCSPVNWSEIILLWDCYINDAKLNSFLI